MLQPLNTAKEVLMTNINCSKECLFQNEGKCCCDNILFSSLSNQTSIDPDCPYHILPQTKQKENANKFSHL